MNGRSSTREDLTTFESSQRAPQVIRVLLFELLVVIAHNISVLITHGQHGVRQRRSFEEDDRDLGFEPQGATRAGEDEALDLVLNSKAQENIRAGCSVSCRDGRYQIDSAVGGVESWLRPEKRWLRWLRSSEVEVSVSRGVQVHKI